MICHNDSTMCVLQIWGGKHVKVHKTETDLCSVKQILVTNFSSASLGQKYMTIKGEITSCLFKIYPALCEREDICDKSQLTTPSPKYKKHPGALT